jgi:hypothetical protein
MEEHDVALPYAQVYPHSANPNDRAVQCGGMRPLA